MRKEFRLNQEKLEWLKRYGSEYTLDELCERLEYPNKLSSFKVWMHKRNLPFKKKSTRLTKEQRRYLKETSGKLTLDEIREYLGYQSSYVGLLAVLRRNGFTYRDKQEHYDFSQMELEWLGANSEKHTLNEILDAHPAWRERWTPKRLGDILRNRSLEYVSERTYTKPDNDGLYDVDENFFEVIDTPEKAYVLGLFVSDGYAGHESLVWRMIDRDVLEIIKRVMKAQQPVYKYDESACTQGFSWMFSITRKKIIQDLRNLGFTQVKTYNCQYPNFVADELQLHVIRGILDGDGTVCHTDKTKSAAWVGTESVMSGIRDVAKQYVDSEANVFQNDVNMWSYKLVNQKALKFLHVIYAGSENLRMQRKYQKYLDMCAHYGETPSN